RPPPSLLPLFPAHHPDEIASGDRPGHRPDSLCLSLCTAAILGPAKSSATATASPRLFKPTRPTANFSLYFNQIPTLLIRGRHRPGKNNALTYAGCKQLLTYDAATSEGNK